MPRGLAETQLPTGRGGRGDGFHGTHHHLKQHPGLPRNHLMTKYHLSTHLTTPHLSKALPEVKHTGEMTERGGLVNTSGGTEPTKSDVP